MLSLITSRIITWIPELIERIPWMNSLITGLFGECSPIAVAILLNVIDEYLIFFRGPRTFLQPHLLAAWSSHHLSLLLKSWTIFFFFLWFLDISLLVVISKLNIRPRRLRGIYNNRRRSPGHKQSKNTVVHVDFSKSTPRPQFLRNLLFLSYYPLWSRGCTDVIGCIVKRNVGICQKGS